MDTTEIDQCLEPIDENKFYEQEWFLIKPYDAGFEDPYHYAEQYSAIDSKPSCI
jgi:hypothetical protein